VFFADAELRSTRVCDAPQQRFSESLQKNLQDLDKI